ncbi:cell division cycle and apoptosis regulator protein 1-like isoform X3 [Mytilus californianus]|uniref:cell division cycle and apoptosis regulator protein 1-like isoform X3 n=1 Tax=Mytilus californianus TaxID=6549 RepID=UPI00224609B9|nr:cell division cycle and apoptosis regulator protein 1-like isoform X3 [Mytilus californianus]
MSQFATPKNPPWARQSATPDMNAVSTPNSISLAQQQAQSIMQAQQSPSIMQQSPMMQQSPTVYCMGTTTPTLQTPQYATQQLSLGLQQQAALQQQGPPQIIPQPGIAIPTTLATNQQVAPVSYPNPRQVQQAAPPKQRVFTGTVTKLHDNFGFVDEDVFFQTSCVKGLIPKVGERVLVEATYNPNMPFKWNATRIQLLPNQVGSNQGKPSVMGQPVPSSLMGDNPGNRPFSSKKGERFRDRERKGFSDIKKEPRERPERPLPLKKRSRSRTPKRGDRSGSPRRRMRVVPRYVVQIPKLSFNLQSANVVTLKSRYSSMYVPSDFFKANFTWMDAFPLTRPFQLGRNCEFHVLHKDVESINTSDALLDPPDADHSFNAKVMLLSCPELEDLYHKSCSLSEDAADVQENFVHPTRLIHFLVGIKGKNETMAIGGAWSPSQDGLKPDEDPKVLIKTAIRTTKALTGIDLSACTQWYRFAEVRYLRPEEIHKGKHLPTRVETTVIFFPDVWSCSPSRLEWASLQTAYKKQLQKKIAAISDGPKDTSSQEEDEDTENIEVRDPTHFSQLDPKAMKIIDLRRELEARTLSSKGLKSQLIARLTKSLKMEQEKEESEEQVKEEASTPMEEEVQKNLEEEKTEEKKKEEEEKKKKEEREKVSLERKYALPENPAILVHPNPTAKSGKFDCAVMSLSVLLDYRPEDNKEHSFEVSLFAELFNEMLMRDFGFEIYKSLVRAPEKKEEEKKDKDKEKDKEKDKDKEKEKDKKSEDKSNKEPTPKKRKKEEDTKETKKDSEKNDRKAYVVKKEDDKSEEKKEEDEEESDDKKKKKDKKKYFTRFPALLLSFTYFDQNHTGYLIDKDVEEIIHTIGLQLSRAQVWINEIIHTIGLQLSRAQVWINEIIHTIGLQLSRAQVCINEIIHTIGLQLSRAQVWINEIIHTIGLQLSRAQVKKLAQKSVSRDSIHYRKMTDKPLPGQVVDKEEESKEIKIIDTETLALGNAEYDPDYKDSKSSYSNRTPKKGEDEVLTGMINYKGSVLDIESLLDRLGKSEKTRLDMEKEMQKLSKDRDTIKTNLETKEESGQKLKEELKQVKQKLSDQEKLTNFSESASKKYISALMLSKDHLTTMLDTVSAALDEKDIKKEDILKKDEEKITIKKEKVENGD